jgi:hypothetical protein
MGRLAEQEVASGQAGRRRDHGDDGQRDHRPARLVSGLRQQQRARTAQHQGVGRPGASHGGQPAADHVRERHGHDGYPGIGQPGGHGQQRRTAAAGGSEAGSGERHRAGGQTGGGQPGMPGHTGDTSGGLGQRDEGGDADDDGQDRCPGGPAQPAIRPQPDRGHAEQQRRGNQHLHDRQRPGAQRDRVGDESAELDAEAKKPPGALHQQQEQPGPARRLAGRRGGLALLQRRAGSVENGRGQRPHDGRHRSTPGQPAGDAAPGAGTAARGLFALSLVANSDMRSTV